MMKILFYFLLAFIFHPVCAQFADSNLPIVIINTNGINIPDAPRIAASMKIIYNGAGIRNYVSEQNDAAKLNYNGQVRIEVRGSSSQALQKKQYGLTTVLADNITNNNVELLGMPKENDWILNGLAFDPSLIRDFISYNLSRQIGNYAPRQQYCELIINGDYRGLYVLQEKIKIDNNRVDIVEMTALDNNLPDVTGGYLTKADKVTFEDPSAWTMPTYLNTQTDFIHEDPKPTEITSAQHTYIKSVFDALATKTTSSSITFGYPTVIDIPSFVDFMIMNELAANVDAYQFSTYFHKDKNAKLRAGPLWDLNLTYGNDLFQWGFDRSKTNTWQFDNGDNVGPRFWRDLFNNSTFRCYLAKRFDLLTQPAQPLNLNNLNTFIDETVAQISEAVVREQQRWGTVGDHSLHVISIKNFLNERTSWMKANLGSFTACSNVAKPPLVINRIHYHPSISTEFPNNDDQEFVEIINTSNNTVTLTGIYFSGVGFVYQFPAGEVLQPRAVIQLANKRETFRLKYGYIPYDQFTRNLSNNSQKLTLADAYGNVIDEVEYSDTSPWPEADGNGMYLKLIDPALDNNIGSNWVATNEPISSTVVIVANEENEIPQLMLYPNPTNKILFISAADIIQSIQLCDVRGLSLELQTINSNNTTIDLSKFPAGVYVIIIQTKNKRTVKKIVRQE